MKIRSLFFLSALVIGAVPPGAPARTEQEAADLVTLLRPDPVLWSLDGGAFMDQYRALGFRWAAEGTRDQARVAHRSLRFDGLRVWEAWVNLNSEGVQALTLYLYNRGDAGDLSQPEFTGLLNTVDERLSRWCGSTATVIRAPQEKRTASKRERKAWVQGPYRLDLVNSYSLSTRRSQNGTRFRAEYVRLTVTPFDLDDDPRKRPVVMRKPQGVLSAFALRARVQRQENGDQVVSGIPMVDQGKKGYCAVATAERLLRYFEREVDQHEMAQEANTSATLGTDTRTLLRVLRSVCQDRGLKVKVLEELDGDDMLKLIEDYNRLAKKADKPRIHADRFTMMIGEIYSDMDADLLTAARAKRTGGLRRFKESVNQYVNGGVPLAWSVVVGVYSEDPKLPVRSGGHMRLIVGYNQRTREILYSDSWGRGHELKRLPIDQAWAMTMGVYTVMPDNIRL
jgi:hypothetical protein